MNYDDATLETKVNEEKVFSLRELVFIYLRDYQKDVLYKDISYEQIDSGKNEINDEKIRTASIAFQSNNSNISRDIIDIFRIFKIDIFLKEWKVNPKEYIFYRSDVEFLCSVLYKYKNDNVWKKIKKVNNSRFDGFVNLYKQDDSAKLLKELRNIFDGFVSMYERRNEGQHEKIEDFKNNLLIQTQLRQIEGMEEIKRILFSLPTLSLDEVYQSLGGKLLQDYQRFLEIVKEKLSYVINQATDIWEENVEDKKKEFDRMLKRPHQNPELFNNAIQHLIQLIKENKENKEIGEYIDAIFNEKQVDENNNKKDEKKERLFQTRVREIIEKTVEELPENEKSAILQVVDYLYNGNQ